MASGACVAAFTIRNASDAWSRCEPLNHEHTVSVFPELTASGQPLVLPDEVETPWSDGFLRVALCARSRIVAVETL
jgi:hypothetical protein